MVVDLSQHMKTQIWILWLVCLYIAWIQSLDGICHQCLAVFQYVSKIWDSHDTVVYLITWDLSVISVLSKCPFLFCLLQSTCRDLEFLLLQYFVSLSKPLWVTCYCVVAENIPPPPHGRCFGLHPHPLQNFRFSSIHFFKNCCIFATPLLLGISLDLPWVKCGYMNFLNLPTMARTTLHDLFTACFQTYQQYILVHVHYLQFKYCSLLTSHMTMDSCMAWQ